MITYSKIGHFGRLGNQMFQFASTYGIARKLNYEVAFPVENVTEGNLEHFKDGVDRYVYFDIPKIFNLNDVVLKPRAEIMAFDLNQIPEPYFHFNEQYFSIPDNCDIGGYLQSEKYFKHVENEIRELFSFKNEIILEAQKLFPSSDKETVAIHVRVGDYAGLELFHPICSIDYYASAISEFLDKEYNFIIFSDDVEYCKNNLFEDQYNVYYLDNKDPYIDLCLMSMCDHNIIANSSFSWWGAWLNKNPNKKVIAPKKWFGVAYNHILKDLYCENWIVK